MKNLAFVGLAALMATAALAANETAVTAPPGSGPPLNSDAVGSIISSFYMTPSVGSYALGIYRDSSYVYGVIYGAGTDYLRSFTTAGSTVGSVALSGASTPRGAAHSHLGSGYVAICDATGNILRNYVVKTGSQVTSFSYAAVGNWGEPFYNGTEYYICKAYNPNLKQWYRFTTTGSLAGVWTASGYPFTYCRAAGFTKVANGQAGTYMVASEAATANRHAIVNMPSGSLIRSWSGPSSGISNGGICGPGAPTSYGTTYWVNTYIGGSLYAYQWDIGGTGSAVNPASLGKIKSLYR